MGQGGPDTSSCRSTTGTFCAGRVERKSVLVAPVLDLNEATIKKDQSKIPSFDNALLSCSNKSIKVQ